MLYTYERRRSAPAPLLVGIGIVFVFALFLVALQLLRGLPAPGVNVTYPESSVLGKPRQPDLPKTGEGVVAVTGLGTLGQSGSDEPRPIASVTKMMTAYVLLKDHPLQPGETGPAVEITTADANRFWQMVAEDQSVQPVNAGQKLTELQLLEGMLVPSANNYAEILAAWDAGSIDAFVAKMNQEAKALGMSKTTYADVSGFSSKSVSTAADQLAVARAAMANPVFASIVGMKQVTLPVAGRVDNVNELLGTAGIVGIKTGYTEEAGGNLAFAAKRDAAGGQIEVIGVVLGQKDHAGAFDATRSILNSLNDGLQAIRAVPAGQPVGKADPAWGGPVDIVTGQDVTMVVWPGMTMQTSIEIDGVKPGGKKGEQVGWLTVRIGEQEQKVALVLGQDMGAAGIGWKLTRF